MFFQTNEVTLGPRSAQQGPGPGGFLPSLAAQRGRQPGRGSGHRAAPRSRVLRHQLFAGAAPGPASLPAPAAVCAFRGGVSGGSGLTVLPRAGRSPRCAAGRGVPAEGEAPQWMQLGRARGEPGSGCSPSPTLAPLRCHRRS